MHGNPIYLLTSLNIELESLKFTCTVVRVEQKIANPVSGIVKHMQFLQ